MLYVMGSCKQLSRCQKCEATSHFLANSAKQWATVSTNRPIVQSGIAKTGVIAGNQSFLIIHRL